MFISASISTSQADQIVRQRLMNMIGLGRYANRIPGINVFIHDGKIMEESLLESGVRTIRTATEMDCKVFDVLEQLERA